MKKLLVELKEFSEFMGRFKNASWKAFAELDDNHRSMERLYDNLQLNGDNPKEIIESIENEKEIDSWLIGEITDNFEDDVNRMKNVNWQVFKDLADMQEEAKKYLELINKLKEV